MTITKRLRHVLLGCTAGLVCLFALMTGAQAQTLSDYSAGTYELEATLSCYVNAMGGVEFGGPLLTSTTLTVDEDGSAWVTIHLTKSSVTIYSVTCDTFVDADPSYVTDDRGVTSGTLGYYDAEGNLITEGVTYTLSDDTALNTASEDVHYVDSITFPLTFDSDTYSLTLYVNSNVMGVQFCNENDQAESTTYPATLTIYWDGAVAVEEDTTSDLEGEEMDGLTIYRADDDQEEEEATEAEETAAEEDDTAQQSEADSTVVHSFLFGDVSLTTAIVIIIIGLCLIATGLVLLGVRIRYNKKKKEEANHAA